MQGLRFIVILTKLHEHKREYKHILSFMQLFFISQSHHLSVHSLLKVVINKQLKIIKISKTCIS